jgi:large subunit ribosomal protein L13
MAVRFGRTPRFILYSRVFEMLTAKSYMPKPGDVEQKWWLVDATDKVVGRLASDIAMVLMGKHRPTYAPHLDTGDYVVVINADKIVFTGKKWQQKEYTWTTYYPGLRKETAEARFTEKPEMILIEAVRRMLPKNKLAVKMLDKLKVYRDDKHPHQAQSPEPKEMGARFKKRQKAKKAV